MGCRCCKMLQSYIFDPQEVQPSGYINEINNYKSDTQDGGKFKGKHNVEIQVHKNELQSAESQPSANRNKLNNTKEAVRNHRNTEEGLSNSREKSNININGIHSRSNLKSNHNTNQNKEVGVHACSAQPHEYSAKGLSQPKECSDTNLDANHPKLPSVATESGQYKQLLTTGENGSVTQSAMPEAQSNEMGSPDSGVSKNAHQQTVAESESPSNIHTHSPQTTEHTVVDKHGDQVLSKAKRCNSGDEAYRTGTLNRCLEDQTVSEIPSQRPELEASPETEWVFYGEANGEFEDEENADIVEALAALEAATAGEDFEEEEEEY